MVLRFVATSSAGPPATDLLEALHDEYDAAAGPDDSNDDPSADHWAEKHLS